MAIALDIGSPAAKADSSVNLTMTYSVSIAATNEKLVVVVWHYASNITAITYNGVPLTLAISNDDYQSPNSHTAIYYLDNPATGTNTLSMTQDATNAIFRSAAAAYSGTTTGVDATGKGTTTGASPLATSVTSVVDNCWMILGTYADHAGLAASTGSTQRAVADESGNKRTGIFDSNGVIHPAGSNSMSVTFSGNGCANAAITIAPAIVTSNSNFLAFM